MSILRLLPIRGAILLLLCSGIRADTENCFVIKVVDSRTGRGVPLVELRTTNDTRWYTDSSGVVAFDDAGLLGRKVFFTISSHGYSYPRDGFGYSGVALDTRPGGSATITLNRVNIAERLYRITGEGIYRDSLAAHIPAPIRSPLFDGQVMGQDTVEVTTYRGKLYWFWGDTSRSGYPLGNFHTSGAISLLPASGGISPELGVDLTYFTDKSGFCKEMIPDSRPGPVWIGGLCTVRDEQGEERLLCSYARVKGLEPVERGIALFNDKLEVFEPYTRVDLNAPRCPRGHPFHQTVGGVDYIYSCNQDEDVVPLMRVQADLKHVADPSAYEAFTCVKPGGHFEGANTALDRTSDGAIRYSWQRGASPLSWKQQQELANAGVLKLDEALIQLRDADTGKQVQPAGGSVYWNEYRHRWIMIFGQHGGSTSLLGEIWYSEAAAPTGPWRFARKIVTHNSYSFYNPTQDRFFDMQAGKRIFFEGTYTKTFSGSGDPTPRYEYNQIMYGLSLDDPRLKLPDSSQ